MATLTTTAYYARKMVVFGLVGLAVLVVSRMALNAFSRWWLKNHPPPPPPPTVSFGVLPEIQFPPSRDRAGLTYKLETVTGSIANLGSQTSVYFMPSYRANVLGLELATGLASKLGFLMPPTAKDEQIYVWTKEEKLPATLTQNLVTGHFSLETPWFRDAEITSGKSPSELEAIRLAKEYLRRGGLLTPDLDTGKTKVEFLKDNGSEFVPALSQSEANYARVHFFRMDVNGLAAVTPAVDEGLVQVVVSGVRSEKQIISAKFKYSPVEQERSATYPLRSVQAAWSQLQAGEGVIIRLVSDNTNVIVRNVELAYYDSDSPQEFLQPVYVFKGDNGFVAYISAVDKKWIGKQ